VRDHDVRRLTARELEHARRELEASLALARPGSPVRVPILARLTAIDTELRSAREWLPPGWFIAAVYWDIESGGIDLEARSQGDAYKKFTDAGLPRDGGMADLNAMGFRHLSVSARF
jgi:hypothetical protein